MWPLIIATTLYMLYMLYVWIILILGSISLLECIIGGSNPMGPTFWIALGVFLLYRANQKKKEKEEKDKWTNQQG
ncbi:MAG: hypothetical protein ACI3X8_09100 [Alloprevotella sp.]